MFDSWGFWWGEILNFDRRLVGGGESFLVQSLWRWKLKRAVFKNRRRRRMGRVWGKVSKDFLSKK